MLKRIRHRDKRYKRAERREVKKHAGKLIEWLEWWFTSF